MNNETYYFTFMLKQGKLQNRYVKIEGTYSETREEMYEMFGDKWAFQYDEKEFLPQIEEFRLSELSL